MIFLELPLKFVTQKVRSHIEEIGINGIALTLHPSVIFFRDDAHQKAHEKGLSVMTFGKKNKPLLPPQEIPIYPSTFISFKDAKNQYRKRNEGPCTVKNDAVSIGNIMNQMLNQLKP